MGIEAMAVLELAGRVLAAMIVVMGAAWLYQRARNNGGWIDAFWTFGTGASCAVAALLPLGAPEGPAWRRVLVAAMVGAWALRLGFHVALRVARSATEDPRYAGFRRDWGDNFQRNMLAVAMVQPPVSAALSVGVILAARAGGTHLRLQDALGLAVFAGCLVGESLADSQMEAFRGDPANKGKVCERGLWAWSRHPNYFFEAAIWLAYPIIAFDPARPWTLAAFVAPILMYMLVRFGSGVPPLEEAMLRSRGEAYRDYQRRVSVLIPRPPRA